MAKKKKYDIEKFEIEIISEDPNAGYVFYDRLTDFLTETDIDLYENFGMFSSFLKSKSSKTVMGKGCVKFLIKHECDPVDFNLTEDGEPIEEDED